MSTFIPESGTQHDFIPHPACRTLGVCADVYLLERLNNFFGKASTLDGKVDNYKTRRVIRFVWLTEVLTADGKPSYVSREFTASDNEKSSLYKFLVAWHPEVSGKRLSKIDMDVFVGSGADLVITNTPSKDGRSVYANVAMCAIPRPTDVSLKSRATSSAPMCARSKSGKTRRSISSFPTSRSGTLNRSPARLCLLLRCSSGLHSAQRPCSLPMRLQQRYLYSERRPPSKESSARSLQWRLLLMSLHKSTTIFRSDYAA